MSISRASTRIPKYALHKASGQAVVRLGGVDIYLGKHDSDESRAEYDRLIGEWVLQGRQAPGTPGSQTTLTVNQLIVAYAAFADGYYRKNGEPTGEYNAIRYALRPLRRLYGNTLTSDFGLDPHITLKAAEYQLDRVAAKWADLTKKDAKDVKQEIESLLKEHASAPLGGMVGVDLINVLEVNLALKAKFGS